MSEGNPDAQAGVVTVRRVRPADKPALADFYASLSADSRYARFLGFSRGPNDESVGSFCTPDHMHDEGFLAVTESVDGEKVVGHLCLEPAGKRRLELAVAVSELYQHHGIGRRLMDAALEWAQAHHVEAILASAFADNFRVLRLLSSAPYPVHLSPADSGVVDVVVPLVPELLPDQPVVIPVELRASALRRRGRRRPSVSRCSRVVWRGTRRPGPGAGG